MTPFVEQLVYSTIGSRRDEERMRYVARGGKRPRTRLRESRLFSSADWRHGSESEGDPPDMSILIEV